MTLTYKFNFERSWGLELPIRRFRKRLRRQPKTLFDPIGEPRPISILSLAGCPWDRGSGQAVRPEHPP